MKVCPSCGKVLAFNSYFGGYICTNCAWEDARIGEKRNMGIKDRVLMTDKFKGVKTTKIVKSFCVK